MQRRLKPIRVRLTAKQIEAYRRDAQSAAQFAASDTGARIRKSLEEIAASDTTARIRKSLKI